MLGYGIQVLKIRSVMFIWVSCGLYNSVLWCPAVSCGFQAYRCRPPVAFAGAVCGRSLLSVLKIYLIWVPVRCFVTPVEWMTVIPEPNTYLALALGLPQVLEYS